MKPKMVFPSETSVEALYFHCRIFSHLVIIHVFDGKTVLDFLVLDELKMF